MFREHGVVEAVRLRQLDHHHRGDRGHRDLRDHNLHHNHPGVPEEAGPEQM